jgi:phosphoribosyl 1,2-cyclic phosphodiesterase
MRLTFLGTRGNIDARSRRHRLHTSTLVSSGRARVMIDCGADWLGRVDNLRPTAIILTHAHSDHVDGLRDGVACAVYATNHVWDQIGRWPIDRKVTIRPYERVEIGGINFEPVPVQHSIRAPAVAFRLGRKEATVFYVPDVLDIPERDRAFANVDLYIGDGATIRRPIQRKGNGSLVGHASIASQLQWCADAGIRRAIFTHCGTGLVTGTRKAEVDIGVLGQHRGIDASVAYDGLTMSFG